MNLGTIIRAYLTGMIKVFVAILFYGLFLSDQGISFERLKEIPFIGYPLVVILLFLIFVILGL